MVRLGHFGLPGVQFTASHNPSGYNGIKFCQANAYPISPEQMAAITELSFAELPLLDLPAAIRQVDDLTRPTRPSCIRWSISTVCVDFAS